VKSRTTVQFRKSFADLPRQVQEQTRAAYRQFKENPSYPSLRFKKVHPELPIYSARISKNYRAVGQLDEDTVIWFWIGSHAEYDKLLSQL
jgi:mRNA-degrading endonuclease RelE of RelBE toxin-antitoxin system